MEQESDDNHVQIIVGNMQKSETFEKLPNFNLRAPLDETNMRNKWKESTWCEKQWRKLDFGSGTPHSKGVAGGKGGKSPPPPETEKIVVEKWCYFRKLYF